jgi:hypothetical protein
MLHFIIADDFLKNCKFISGANGLAHFQKAGRVCPAYLYFEFIHTLKVIIFAAIKWASNSAE